MSGDDKGPMQGPRTTRDVMKAAPRPKRDRSPPDRTPAEDATHAVRPDQEDA